MQFSWRIGLIGAALALTGCGGSGSDDAFETLTVTAALDEDTQWQQAVTFTGTPVVIAGPSNGVISVGAAQVTYTPAENFNGLDSALVEAGSQRFSFQFNVAAVNDAPVISANVVRLTAANEMQGQLEATDVEGDAIQFELVSAPATGVFELFADGSFSYRLDDLTLPFSSFEVAVSDGMDSTQAEVEVRPAYSSNADKAAYYYRSSESHLRQAATRLEPLNDDVQTSAAYTALAVGYARAALPNQVEQIFSEQLRGQQNRANALRDIADVYEQTGALSDAAGVRLEALQLYASFVTDNGIENLSSNDASFFLGLLNDQVGAGDSSGAEATISQLQLYTSALGGIDSAYSTAFGRLITAYRNQVREALAVYQSSGLEADRLIALTAVDRFAAVVAETGYQVLTRGEFAGERAFRLAPLYAVQAVEYYFLLGELEQARAQLAEVVSYYGEASYDSTYIVAAKPYAAVSRLDYQFPLVDAAGYFALLYPSASLNMPLELIPSDDSDYTRAQDAVADGEALSIVLQGGSVLDAVNLLEQRYTNDLRELQTRLSRNTASSPYLGAQLLLLGYEQEARVALERGLEVLSGSAYWAENGASTLYMTGTRGCLKFVELFDAAGLNARDAALVCERMALEHFAALDGAIGVDDVMLSGLDAAAAWQFVDDSAAALNVLEQRSEWLASAGLSAADLVEYQLALAVAMVNNGAVDAGLDLVAAALASVTDGLSGFEQAEGYLNVLEGLAGLSFADDSIFDRDSILVQLRSTAYNNARYSEWTSRSAALVDEVTARFSSAFNGLAALEQVDIAEPAILALADARQYAVAENLVGFNAQRAAPQEGGAAPAQIGAAPLGVAEQIALTALLSERQAGQDDFPLSPIATVDTDADGLANFLAVNATEAQLAANDIATDNDADNDGIDDADDLNPLGE